MKKAIVCKNGKVKKLYKLLQDIIDLNNNIDKLLPFNVYDASYNASFNIVKLTYMAHKLYAKRKNLLAQFETLLLNIVLINKNEKLLRALYTKEFFHGLIKIKNFYNDENEYTFNIAVLAFFAKYYELSKNRGVFIAMCVFDNKLLQIVFDNKSIYNVFEDVHDEIEDIYAIEHYLYEIVDTFFYKYKTQFRNYLRRTRNKSFNNLCIERRYRKINTPVIQDEEIPF